MLMDSVPSPKIQDALASTIPATPGRAREIQS
jgi:hypothetical protein